MPLLPNYASTLSTQVKMEDGEESHEYFGLLQSIFNLYIQRMGIYENHNSGRVSKTKENRMGAKLSERQELILEMIKDGMTNSSIANRMGYSESLIRQESMAIYQKLGVDGRRDLVRSDLLDESSDDESHGIQT
jgi:DNA-binding NarL/FixJ family response regulator